MGEEGLTIGTIHDKELGLKDEEQKLRKGKRNQR